VIAELTGQPETMAAAEMDVEGTRCENVEHDKLRREKLLQHIRFL
jgi:hypothetical protein